MYTFLAIGGELHEGCLTRTSLRLLCLAGSREPWPSPSLCQPRRATRPTLAASQSHSTPLLPLSPSPFSTPLALPMPLVPNPPPSRAALVPCTPHSHLGPVVPQQLGEERRFEIRALQTQLQGMAVMIRRLGSLLPAAAGVWEPLLSVSTSGPESVRVEFVEAVRAGLYPQLPDDAGLAAHIVKSHAHVSPAGAPPPFPPPPVAPRTAPVAPTCVPFPTTPVATPPTVPVTTAPFSPPPPSRRPFARHPLRFALERGTDRGVLSRSLRRAVGHRRGQHERGAHVLLSCYGTAVAGSDRH